MPNSRRKLKSKAYFVNSTADALKMIKNEKDPKINAAIYIKAMNSKK